jgi:hypothetical protein
MAFIQPCFIRKNTAELRRKLESLGYRKGDYPLPVGREDVYDRDIHLYENSYHFRDSTLYGITNNIDCGTNEDLFFALAALRDDSDKNQYFICDKVSFTIGKSYYPDDYLYYQYDEFFDKQNWHKATVEEIIEHFKKE